MKMLGFAAHFWKPPSQPHILHKIDKKMYGNLSSNPYRNMCEKYYPRH